MLNILIIIAIILVVAIVGILILAATKPDTFSVTRTIDIAASPETIFPMIDDLHQWVKWSPYEAKDPAMKKTFSGADKGKGAVYAWDGDKNVGTGRMEIIDIIPSSKVVIKLDFFKPFEGHNTAEFILLPHGPTTSVTTVTWKMYGPAAFITKIMQTIINMDNMVGKDFAVGLVNLKTIIEQPQAT